MKTQTEQSWDKEPGIHIKTLGFNAKSYSSSSLWFLCSYLTLSVYFGALLVGKDAGRCPQYSCSPLRCKSGAAGQHKPKPTQISLSGSCPAAVAISAQGRTEAPLWFSFPVPTVQGVFARAVLFPPRMLMLFLWNVGVYGDGLLTATEGAF